MNLLADSAKIHAGDRGQYQCGSDDNARNPRTRSTLAPSGATARNIDGDPPTNWPRRNRPSVS